MYIYIYITFLHRFYTALYNWKFNQHLQLCYVFPLNRILFFNAFSSFMILERIVQ